MFPLHTCPNSTYKLDAVKVVGTAAVLTVSPAPTFVTTAFVPVQVKLGEFQVPVVGAVPLLADVASENPEASEFAALRTVVFLLLRCSAGTAIKIAARIAPAIASTISTSTIVKPLLLNATI